MELTNTPFIRLPLPICPPGSGWTGKFGLAQLRAGGELVSKGYSRRGSIPHLNSCGSALEIGFVGLFRTLLKGKAHVPFPPFILSNLLSWVDVQSPVTALPGQAIIRQHKNLFYQFLQHKVLLESLPSGSSCRNVPASHRGSWLFRLLHIGPFCQSKFPLLFVFQTNHISQVMELPGCPQNTNRGVQRNIHSLWGELALDIQSLDSHPSQLAPCGGHSPEWLSCPRSVT